MIKNYFTVAWRNLVRHKEYSFINITGLAVGIAACLLIFLVIQFEKSFDNFHKNKDQIYRVARAFSRPSGIEYDGAVSFPVAEGLRLDYPQLKKVAAIFSSDNIQFTIQKDPSIPPEKFKEAQGAFFAEPSFFELFNFKWLSGNPQTALAEPNSAILTKSAAEKYFGDWKSAMGKSIQPLGGAPQIKITGILENIPPNTDFPLKIVVSYKTLQGPIMNDWVSVQDGAYVFVELPSGLSAAQFNFYLKDFVRKHKPAEYVKDGLLLQPLHDMHFDGRFGNYNKRTFSKELITALSLIAAFILIIACVNFINLATAQAVNRSKEVGVRKVLGSRRKNLMLQFMVETALVTIFAMLLAVALSLLALPFLKQLLNLPLEMNFINNPVLIIFLVAVSLLVILLAGCYPALVLSGFNPVTALKSKLSIKIRGGVSLRRGLVVLQFVIAQVLIIGTLIVISQMHYFQNQPLGFNKDAIINVPIPGDSLSHVKSRVLRQQLLQQPGIKSISFGMATPSDNDGWYSNFKFDHATKSSDFYASLKWADTAYFNTYQLQLVAGRIYQESDTTREFVVNEAFLKKFGIRNPEEVLGKELNFWDGRIVAPIVGVVKDFHTTSLRDAISPVVMGCRERAYGTMGVKIEPQKTKAALAAIEKIWSQAYPDYIYEYQFLDDKIESFYKQENQLSQLYKIFAGIAIFISCLGLYGLVSFMAVQRTKEVGVRKVLGASAGSIVYLFSKEFVILIVISFFIAAPIAYYFMHQWLQNYTYRINLNAGVFIITILGSILIAWLTVGYRSLKAALASPVKSLRTE